MNLESYDLDAIPRHQKAGRKPGQKHFGVQQWSDWFKKWYIRRWYPTEKQRDQALQDLIRHAHSPRVVGKLLYHRGGEIPYYRKIDR